MKFSLINTLQAKFVYQMKFTNFIQLNSHNIDESYMCTYIPIMGHKRKAKLKSIFLSYASKVYNISLSQLSSLLSKSRLSQLSSPKSRIKYSHNY